MIRSMRIARFEAETAGDPAAALKSLQRDLETSRGPLVEEISGSDNVLVTFVFVGPAEAPSVRVACELWPVDLGQLALGPEMTRIAGTDVWYASVETDPRMAVPYQFQVNPPSWGETLEELHAMLADEKQLAALMREMFDSGRADPHNPERHYPYNGLLGGDPDGTATEDKWQSILTLPAAEPFPYLDGQGLRGRLEEHVLPGKELPGERAVTVYLPPDYQADRAYPLVVLLDGELLLKCGRLDRVLDSAIVQGEIPPVVAVFWHNLTIASRMTEMACNPALPDALADELLPWVRARYSVTDDPSKVVIGGQSFGGLSSAWIPFRRPDAFGAAFIISPSFWFTPPDAGEATAEVSGGWLTQEYEAAGIKPVRMYIAVGMLESGAIPYPGMNGQSMVDLARNFRDALRSRGYDIAGYREEPGGHNHVTVQRLLVPGLRALLSETGD
jgi:enterochelin esterase family protein